MPAPRSHLIHSSDPRLSYSTRIPTRDGALLPTGSRPLSVTDILVGRSITPIPAPRSVSHIHAPPSRRQLILPIHPGQIVALRFSSWSPVHAGLREAGYDDSPGLHYAKGARPAIVLRCAVDVSSDAVAFTVLPITSLGRTRDKKHISWALQDYVLRARAADDQVDTTHKSSCLTFDGTIPVYGLDCSTSWVIVLPFDVISSSADVWSIVPYYDSVINKNSSTTKQAFVSGSTLRALIKLVDKNRDTFIGELKRNPDFAESVRYEMYLSVLPPGHPIPPSKKALALLKATQYHANEPSSNPPSSASTSNAPSMPRSSSSYDSALTQPITRPRRPLPPIPTTSYGRDISSQTTPTALFRISTSKGASRVALHDLEEQAPLDSTFDAEDEYLVSSADIASTVAADLDEENTAPITPTKVSHTPLTPGPHTPPKRISDTPLPSRPSKRRSEGKPTRRFERSPSPSPSPASRIVKEIFRLASVSKTPPRETQLISELPCHSGTMLAAMERLQARRLMEKAPTPVPHRSSSSEARPLLTPSTENSDSIESEHQEDNSWLKIADVLHASSGAQSAASEPSQPGVTSSIEVLESSSSAPEPEPPAIPQTLAEACSSYAWAQSSASTVLYVAKPSTSSLT
ncbi:hypothetical protein K525DRAFT_274028 [Schizophyllum commune Loenen D]|nr:hypothetical protein K525DRAFT_274028 [Schizophyllum commune Loenen D]